MKKYHYLLLLLFLIPLVSHAKLAPGYLVRAKGDTLWVHFKIGANNKKAWFKRNQEAIIYFDAKGKKHLLMPAQAKAVGFLWNSDTVRLYSFPNTVDIYPLSLDDDGHQFFTLEAKGKVHLFSFVETETANTGGFIGPITTTVRSYFLQYEKHPLYRVSPKTFKADMADFFREHKQLVAKINTGKYTVENLPEMVKEYNALRAQDTYDIPAEPIDGF